MVNPQIFSQIGFNVEAKGNLVTLVTDEIVDNSYRSDEDGGPILLKQSLKLPIVLIATPQNTLIPLVCNDEFRHGPDYEFRVKVIKELRKLQQPLYSFYGEFYRRAIFVASGFSYFPEITDLRNLCCKELLGIHEDKMIRQISRSDVINFLGLSTRRIRGITGDVAMQAFRALEGNITSRNSAIVYDFLMNAMYNDTKMLYKCWEEGLIENERSA